jgi:phosphoserine/homoserine phosphotransferase
MDLVCLDLEGVLIPEIWINFAEKTGIEELKLTTRDIPDYDVLMTKRLGILEEHGLGIEGIEEVVSAMEPMEGAKEFLDELQKDFQVIILSDTFYEFGLPLVRKLGNPTLFCHKLKISETGKIDDYIIRIDDPKRRAVQAFHGLNFRVIAAGDSYNDTNMLSEADAGILFKAPDNVIEEFPQFPSVSEYNDLLGEIQKAAAQLG